MKTTNIELTEVKKQIKKTFEKCEKIFLKIRAIASKLTIEKKIYKSINQHSVALHHLILAVNDDKKMLVSEKYYWEKLTMFILIIDTYNLIWKGDSRNYGKFKKTAIFTTVVYEKIVSPFIIKYNNDQEGLKMFFQMSHKKINKIFNKKLNEKIRNEKN